MKKIFILLIFSTRLCPGQAQQNFIGTWEGKLGTQIRLIFHFDKTINGQLFGTLDSPDKGVTGLPLTSLKLKGDSLLSEIDVAKVKYNALLSNDSTLSGIWLQGGSRITFSLHKTNERSNIKIPNRPQTPLPPFQYRSEEVEYDNADKSVHLGATYTYPSVGKPIAFAILITGSGLQDRDETLFYHHPFAVIADYLTKRGYAVLRVDDRSIGKSTGEAERATSADFANDVIAGINYLKTRSETDSTKIGLIGHSEGGYIAPIVYTKWPHLSFIISLAGTGIPGASILLRQQTDPLKDHGITGPAFNASYELTRKTLYLIHDNPLDPDSVILQKSSAFFEEWKKSLPDSIQIQLHAKELTGRAYSKQVAIELQPWLRYFISTDPRQFLQQVKCPVLALNGEKDIQVYPNENISAIAGALQSGGNKSVTVKIIPGLNHLFQHCHTCTIKEYGELEETFAPEALEIMARWLDNTFKKNK